MQGKTHNVELTTEEAFSIVDLIKNTGGDQDGRIHYDESLVTALAKLSNIEIPTVQYTNLDYPLPTFNPKRIK